jgi:hypothetical protein
MADWRISRRRGTCSACERVFDDGERYMSSLRVTPEGLERADLCPAYWDGKPEAAHGEACRRACQERAESGIEGAVEGQDLFWWATRHQVERKKTVQLDLESLERLFLELEGKTEPAVQELRYVLCLILMRKRRLKVERVLRTAEGEAFRVKRPRRDERYEVRVFDFTAERMAEVRTQLQAIFDGAETVDGVGVEEPAEVGPEETPVDQEVSPEDDPALTAPAPAGEGVE